MRREKRKQEKELERSVMKEEIYRTFYNVKNRTVGKKMARDKKDIKRNN